ncbi:MAG: hypothetical protein QM743_06355 [Chitinophagaceae bacterium]
MANNLYEYSGATDSPTKDAYDICSGVANVVPINDSIKKVIIPNVYRYMPIRFAQDSNVRNDFGDIKVYKVSNGTSTLVPSSDWTYYETHHPWCFSI